MARAVALARTRVGATGANPAVGCVIVRDGRVLAEGATAAGGSPHAEESAVSAFAADALRGATAFVTLEPCGERSSGALSCAEQLVRVGVARVIVACADGSVMAQGRGLAHLREAGVRVEVGLLADEAAPLYASYRARLTR